MEIKQAIDAVRVVRTFNTEPLDDAVVGAICNAGRRAGSSKNLQRWAFIVVRDRARLAELAATGPFAGHVGGASAGVALVTPDPHAADAPLSIMFDLGRAAQSMVLTAWDCGVGACPATVYDQPLVRAILRLPDGFHCEYLLSLGYPADSKALTQTPRAGGRTALDAVVHAETWS